MQSDYDIVQFVIDADVSLTYNRDITHAFERRYPHARGAFGYDISLGSLTGTVILHIFKNAWENYIPDDPTDSDLTFAVAICRWRIMTKYMPTVRYHHRRSDIKHRLDNMFFMLNEYEHMKLLLRADEEDYVSIDGDKRHASIIRRWQGSPTLGTPPMERRGWGYPPKDPDELYYDYVARPTGLEKYEDCDPEEFFDIPQDVVLFAPKYDPFSERLLEVKNGTLGHVQAMKLNGDFEMGEVIETHLGWGLVNRQIIGDSWFTDLVGTKEEAIEAAERWFNEAPHRRKVICRS